jgi:hypothetical protein
MSTNKTAMTELPPNIQQFNIVAGLIFAQLYKAFPHRINIDAEGIASAMGITGEWQAHVLPSGCTFPAVVSDTLSWLADENFIDLFGLAAPGVSARLAGKGLAAMNAVPVGLKATVGSSLTVEADKGWKSGLGPVGELIGSILGGAIKSAGSGQHLLTHPRFDGEMACADLPKALKQNEPASHTRGY